jgi:hypothetical protein
VDCSLDILGPIKQFLGIMDPHNWHPDDNYRFNGSTGPGYEPLGEGLNMSECFLLIVKLY